ncbi:MAG: GNAT family N-acetyltransferase [Acetatifactor sp.]
MELERLYRKESKIEGDKVFLRPIQSEDVESLLDIYGDESVYRYRPGMPRKTLPLIQKLLKRMQREEEERKAFYYAVCEKKEGNAVVGIVEIFNVDGRTEQVEIGYTIAPNRQGRGLASEAIGVLTDYLICQVGLNRVRAMVHVDNIASQKALLKNGFQKEGTERQGEFWQGVGFVDVCRFAKLRIDYD